jgi:hypothetical protein
VLYVPFMDVIGQKSEFQNIWISTLVYERFVDINQLSFFYSYVFK